MPQPLAAALVAFAGLGLAACGAHPEAIPVTPPADAALAVDCTAPWDVGWGAVPADFEPVAVYVCDPELQLSPPTTLNEPLVLAGPDQLDGGLPAAPESDPAPEPEPEPEPAVDPEPAAEPQRLEGDLTALLAAFAVPNDPRWPGPCSAIGVIVPDVWLVDVEGRAIRPAYPVNGCGLPKEGVGAALAELTPVD